MIIRLSQPVLGLGSRSQINADDSIVKIALWHCLFCTKWAQRNMPTPIAFPCFALHDSLKIYRLKIANRPRHVRCA